MNDLKKYSNEELVKMVINKEIKAKDLTDSSICPTCFDKENNHILYGNKDDRMIYDDDLVEVFFDARPKSVGHVIIVSKRHYKDMMEIPDDLCNYVFILTKKLMNIIKKVYGSESVYLCTMCDGPMNHFHLQLIPRYKEEKRGSNNFVKERKEYVYDKEKMEKIKNLLGGKNENI